MDKSKKFESDSDQDGTEPAKAEPILSKYRKPAADAERERKEEEAARLQRIKKEKQRLQGRVLPRKEDEEHERNLIRMATKGVVQLFNTVAEFQSSEKKEVHKEVVAQKTKYSRILEATGDAYANTSNKKIIEKLQSKDRKWKVLNPDDESEYDSEGNIKIADFDDDKWIKHSQ